jgi:hypothetical protein
MNSLYPWYTFIRLTNFLRLTYLQDDSVSGSTQRLDKADRNQAYPALASNEFVQRAV